MTQRSISELQHPPIRSFVLRSNRITSAQQAVLESSWPLYGIDFNTSLLDLDKIFARRAPKILEIGSGMGLSIATMANQNRENDYLAVEVYRPGVGSLIRHIEENKLSNIRIVSYNIIDILKHQLAENSIDNIYLFFPDPWPKKRHHKRRLINAAFFSLVKKVLQTQGCLFIATDWQDYAEGIMQLISNDPQIINLAGKHQYAPRPAWRPITKFEQRGLDAGRGIYEIALSFRD